MPAGGHKRLPEPTTVMEYYLAAVLDELRALNETMGQLAKRAQPATPSTAAKTQPAKSTKK